MRYRFLYLLLVVSLSACTFQVDVLTPEPSIPTTVAAIQSVTLPPIETLTPTPLPTLSVQSTSTFTALPQVAGLYPIKFSPNGTYVDVVDSILVETSKTYSIDAAKGQVMSVSIHQGVEGDWVYIPIQITGADGAALCPPVANAECTFWRGILPATQEYFVKITPVNDVLNFTLRVAINPPGVATQSFQYSNARQNASFSYTDEFAPTGFAGPQVSKMEPEVALELIDSQFYMNTNLSEAYFLFGSTNESSMVESCTQPISFGGEEHVVGDVNINGNTFVRSESSGVGAGNIYEQLYHRAAINGYCYEVAFFFHYTNIGNYSPDAGIKEFDRTALLQRFESILSTLVIK